MNIIELEKAYNLEISILKGQLILQKDGKKFAIRLPKRLNKAFLSKAIKKFLALIDQQKL